MSEDDKKQEKMDVLYEIAEMEVEIGCIESSILGTSKTFESLSEKLPEYANPPKGTTPSSGFISHSYLSFEELSALAQKLDSCRRDMENLRERRNRLYPASL